VIFPKERKKRATRYGGGGTCDDSLTIRHIHGISKRADETASRGDSDLKI
jgi:hypothetical protein